MCLDTQFHKDFMIGFDREVQLEGIAAACVLIASKFEEVKPMRLNDILKCIKQSDNPKLVISIE